MNLLDIFKTIFNESEYDILDKEGTFYIRNKNTMKETKYPRMEQRGDKDFGWLFGFRKDKVAEIKNMLA